MQSPKGKVSLPPILAKLPKDPLVRKSIVSEDEEILRSPAAKVLGSLSSKAKKKSLMNIDLTQL